MEVYKEQLTTMMAMEIMMTMMEMMMMMNMNETDYGDIVIASS